MPSTSFVLSDWLPELATRQPEAAQLLRRSPGEQQVLGYYHTLREICQQPASWLFTSQQMCGLISPLHRCVRDIESLVLTGSGSSEYAGDCVRLVLQAELGVTTQAIGGGALLTHGVKALPPPRPGLIVSLARSGDSPESVGALSLLLEGEPELRHLVLTCNAKGKLAERSSGDPRVHVIALDDDTNDRSLVMTSSFTNLVLAARILGLLEAPERYEALSHSLSRTAATVIETYFGTFARVAALQFNRAMFLGSGSRFGSARESALKMLEMTAGRVTTNCETYLGLRHGPMSYVHNDTLVVCFLSSEHTLRTYECDLLMELDQKGLGLVKLVVGENIPTNILRDQDITIDCPGLAEIGDENAPLIDVLVGQLLGFFRSMHEGLRPDSPSEAGVINRVVHGFKLHAPGNSTAEVDADAPARPQPTDGETK
jgi:tagatose-6-phosphate ketose/aldose isomerase